MSTPTHNQTLTLVRGLTLIAAISIIIGNVIGTGVFLKARVMTCNVGTPGMVMTAPGASTSSCARPTGRAPASSAAGCKS